MASKPRVFIGSSVGGIPIAAAIHDNLKHNAEVTPWNQGAFELSKTTIESLTHALDTSDYGIFVFSRDDVVNLKGKRYSAVRDNVLFELGLFIGRLGRDRTFIVAPDDADAAKEIKLRIPTDLVGITLGTFENSRTDGNLIAATGSFSASVKTAIAKLGRLHAEEINENTVDNKINSLLSREPEQKASSENKTDWASLLAEKKYPEALVAIEKALQEEKNAELITNLKLGQITCTIAIDSAQGYKDLASFYELNKGDLSAVINIAIIYIDRSYNQQAISIIQEALMRNQDNHELIFLKSRALNNLGRAQEAIEFMEASPDNIKTSIKLASLLEIEKDYERAFNSIHQAYIKFPDSDEIMLKFAQLAGADKLSNRDDEIVLFIADRLVNKYPGNAEYHMQLGFACLGLELRDVALQHYRKAEETLKTRWVYSNIGALLRDVGLYEEAKLYFQKALKEDVAVKDESSYLLTFIHTQMSELLSIQEENKDKYWQHLKNGRRKVSIEPSYARELPPLSLSSSNEPLDE